MAGANAGPSSLAFVELVGLPRRPRPAAAAAVAQKPSFAAAPVRLCPGRVSQLSCLDLEQADLCGRDDCRRLELLAYKSLSRRRRRSNGSKAKQSKDTVALACVAPLSVGEKEKSLSSLLASISIVCYFLFQCRNCHSTRTVGRRAAAAVAELSLARLCAAGQRARQPASHTTGGGGSGARSVPRQQIWVSRRAVSERQAASSAQV